MQNESSTQIEKIPPASLNRFDAADYIASSVRTLDELATAGEIRRLKIGRATKFLVRDLDAFLERKVQSSGAKS